jgi:hypothetical protein
MHAEAAQGARPSFRLWQAQRWSALSMAVVAPLTVWYALGEQTGARVDNVTFGILYTVLFLTPFLSVRLLRRSSKPPMVWLSAFANALFFLNP